MSETQVQTDRMGGDLLAAMIDELRLLPKPWPSLPEAEQAEVIERLRKRVTYNVREAVAGIACGGRVAVGAKMEAMTLKSVCKVLLTVDGSAAKHELLDALGSNVVVVLTDVDKYLAGIGDIKPDDEQRSLDIEGAADDAIRRAQGHGGSENR